MKYSGHRLSEGCPIAVREIAVKEPTCTGTDSVNEVRRNPFFSSPSPSSALKRVSHPFTAGWRERVSKNLALKLVLNPGPSAPAVSTLTTQPQCISYRLLDTVKFPLKHYLLKLLSAADGGSHLCGTLKSRLHKNDVSCLTDLWNAGLIIGHTCDLKSCMVPWLTRMGFLDKQTMRYTAQSRFLMDYYCQGGMGWYWVGFPCLP